MKRLPLMFEVWRQPERLGSLDLAQWDLLLRQADSAHLNAALFYLAEQHADLAALPAPVRDRLDWARVLAERHVLAVRWELNRIAVAVAETGVSLIVLKGAAYTAAGLPWGRGRLYSDIDILVPQRRIGEVEVALLAQGWRIDGYDAYDQRYYRQWMHELPPMQHVRRGTTIDVHHAILPPTARVHPDADKLRAAAVAIDGAPGLCMLAPTDLVLHSAVHLFFSEEFAHGLRDLIDLHGMLQYYGSRPGFWTALAERAVELQLQRPLFYACRYCALLLGTSISAELQHVHAPGAALRWWMDRLFLRAFMPPHSSTRRAGSAAALFLLYIRGHWLRMPPLMLARHLVHKAFISPKQAAE